MTGDNGKLSKLEEILKINIFLNF